MLGNGSGDKAPDPEAEPGLDGSEDEEENEGLSSHDEEESAE